MRIIPSFDPSVTTTQPYISVGAADANCKLLLYNESNYNLALDFQNGSSSILHAWEARYWTLDGDTPQVNWSIESILNLTNPPISSIKGELYGKNEKVEGSYPIALIRQASVGNPGGLQTSVNNAVGIVNDNNPVGSQMIEATLQGQTNSSWKFNNDATGQLSVLIGGILVQILKTANVDPVVTLGALSHMVEVLGDFKVDGTANLGLTKVFGALQAMSTASLDNGGIFTNGSGLLTVSRLGLPVGFITRISTFSGTGGTTANHGLGVTPTIVLASYAGSFGTTPTPIYYGGETATTVNIFASAGFFWRAIALAL